MNLTEYRNSKREKLRLADLMRHVPDGVESALDVGARDGFVSKLLVDRVGHVTALDLDEPSISDDRVRCVSGNVTSLDFDDDSFELVLCAEVLEHIPPNLLQVACDELSRITSRFLLIGVPFKQDIRAGRTTCQACGGKNPPWGHVNSFDKSRLAALFNACSIVGISFVGKTRERTNFLTCWLLDLSGNPYGTYSQEEPCVYCGSRLELPAERNFFQKSLTKIGVSIQKAQRYFLNSQPIWIHVMFEKSKIRN